MVMPCEALSTHRNHRHNVTMGRSKQSNESIQARSLRRRELRAGAEKKSLGRPRKPDSELTHSALHLRVWREKKAKLTTKTRQEQAAMDSSASAHHRDENGLVYDRDDGNGQVVPIASPPFNRGSAGLAVASPNLSSMGLADRLAYAYQMKQTQKLQIQWTYEEGLVESQQQADRQTRSNQEYATEKLDESRRLANEAADKDFDDFLSKFQALPVESSPVPSSTLPLPSPASHTSIVATTTAVSHSPVSQRAKEEFHELCIQLRRFYAVYNEGLVPKVKGILQPYFDSRTESNLWEKLKDKYGVDPSGNRRRPLPRSPGTPTARKRTLPKSNLKANKASPRTPGALPKSNIKAPLTPGSRPRTLPQSNLKAPSSTASKPDVDVKDSATGNVMTKAPPAAETPPQTPATTASRRSSRSTKKKTDPDFLY